MGNSPSQQNPTVMGKSHEDDQPAQASNWGMSSVLPANHPKDGDISKCPVMGFNGKRKGNTGTNPLTALLDKKQTQEEPPTTTTTNSSNNNNTKTKAAPPPPTRIAASREEDRDDGYVSAYSEVNPLNNMPLTPSQMPHPDQKKSLPIDRQPSTIPRTKSDNTWLYPSEQMFYNALKRKNKYDSDISEDDLKAIVAIHNGMNEKTWRELMRWENCIHQDCPTPTLMHFCGRPNDLSPKAFLKHYLLRYPMPFDRHDWVIDRCGSKKQRYVIDFYYKENIDQDAEFKNGFVESRRILIDVRPALDDWQSAYDRFKFFFTERYQKYFGKSN